MDNNLNDKEYWVYNYDYIVRNLFFSILVSIMGTIVIQTFPIAVLKIVGYIIISLMFLSSLFIGYVKINKTLNLITQYYETICTKYMDKNKFFTDYFLCTRNFRTRLETSMDYSERIVGVDGFIHNLYLNKKEIRYVLTGIPGVGKKSFSLILSLFLLKRNSFFRICKKKQKKIIFPLWFSMSEEYDIDLLIKCLKVHKRSQIYTYIKGRKLLKNRIIIRKKWFPLFIIDSWDKISPHYKSNINIGHEDSFVIFSRLNNEPALSGSEIFNLTSRFSFLPLNNKTAQSFLIKLYEIDKKIAEYIVNQITTKLGSNFLIPFFLEKIIDTIREFGNDITIEHFDAYLDTTNNTCYGLLNEYFTILIIKALRLDDSNTELSLQKKEASKLIPGFAEITYELVKSSNNKFEFIYSDIKKTLFSTFKDAHYDNDKLLEIYINSFFISQYLRVPIRDESSHVEISHSLLRDYLLATAISEKWDQNKTLLAEEGKIFLTWMSDPNFDDVWYLLSEKWRKIDKKNYTYKFIKACFKHRDKPNKQEFKVLQSCFNIFQQDAHINNDFKNYWKDTYEHYYSIDFEPFQRLRLCSKGIKTILFDFLKVDEKKNVISELSSCKSLETLSFFETDVSMVTFSNFRRDNQIRTLNLISSKINDFDLNSLNNLSNLEELSFSWNKNKLKLCTFSNCKELKDLVITSGDIEIILTNENVFPKLQSITLIGTQKSEKTIDLSFLQNFKKLESIIIWGYKIKSTELEFIGSETLKSLWLINTGIENIHLDKLEEFPDLKQLVLLGNLLEQIDLKPLEKCCKLELLNLGNNPLTEIDVTPIIYLGNLKLFFYKNQEPVKLLCKRKLKKPITSPALKAIKKDCINFYW